MPKFAANISLMYPEVPFLDRFDAAARDGFTAVELQFPYEFPAAAIALRLRAAGVQLVLLNLPPGDWERGERGRAAIPGREADFRADLARGMAYALELGCPRFHAMAGKVAPGADLRAMRQTFIENLRYAAREAGKHRLDVLIEPLNSRDNPSYFLSRQDDARAIVTEVGASNLKIQFDFYHVQIMEGDCAMNFRKHQPNIGHVQIAGVPERHEPDIGELNYPYLLRLLDELGYDGWVGAEYRPQGNTSAGLGWFKTRTAH